MKCQCCVFHALFVSLCVIFKEILHLILHFSSESPAKSPVIPIKRLKFNETQANDIEPKR